MFWCRIWYLGDTSTRDSEAFLGQDKRSKREVINVTQITHSWPPLGWRLTFAPLVTAAPVTDHCVVVRCVFTAWLSAGDWGAAKVTAVSALLTLEYSSLEAPLCCPERGEVVRSPRWEVAVVLLCHKWRAFILVPGYVDFLYEEGIEWIEDGSQASGYSYDTYDTQHTFHVH